MTPHKLKKECHLLRSCLGDAGSMLFFMAEQVLLLMGEVWLKHDADTQCTAGREEAKGQRRIFMFEFSGLAIKYEFYFTG